MSTESELRVIGGDQSYDPFNVEEAEIPPPHDGDFPQVNLLDGVPTVRIQAVLCGQERQHIVDGLQRPAGTDPIREPWQAQVGLFLNEVTGMSDFEKFVPQLGGPPITDVPNLGLPPYGVESDLVDLADVAQSLAQARRGQVTNRRPFNVDEATRTRGGDPSYHPPKYDLC